MIAFPLINGQFLNRVTGSIPVQAHIEHGPLEFLPFDARTALWQPLDAVEYSPGGSMVARLHRGDTRLTYRPSYAERE
jgi:hypothetical protein